MTRCVRASEALIAAAVIAGPVAVPGSAQTPNDTVADIQSMNAFSSVQDGQPGPPGALQLQLNIGWIDYSTSSVAFIYPQLEYTPSGSSFLRNANIQLAVPVELQDGTVSAGPTFAAWQQRWVADPDLMFTVASLLQVQVPTGPGPAELGATLTGVVIKQVGAGNAYWNGSVSVGGGGTLQEWGLVAAYRLPVSSVSGVSGAYVCVSQTGGPLQNVLELAADYTLSDVISIGPGVVFGLDRGSLTPRLGVGVRFFFTF